MTTPQSLGFRGKLLTEVADEHRCHKRNYGKALIFFLEGRENGRARQSATVPNSQALGGQRTKRLMLLANGNAWKFISRPVRIRLNFM